MRAAALGTVCALALAFLPARSGSLAFGEEPPIVRTPEFTKRVEAAVAKGVAWLRSVQIEDGRFSGSVGDLLGDLDDMALAYVSLRAAGIARDDPMLEKIYRWLGAQPDPTVPPNTRSAREAALAAATGANRPVSIRRPRSVGERTNGRWRFASRGRPGRTAAGPRSRENCGADGRSGALTNPRGGQCSRLPPETSTA